jgi:hypothetical protein
VQTPTLEPLKDGFTIDGFIFTQLKRTGDVALFGKRKPNWAKDVFTYEVVVIQQKEAYTLFDRSGPAREAMPKNEDWGKFGWSYQNLEAAKLKFKNLVGELPEPANL